MCAVWEQYVTLIGLNISSIWMVFVQFLLTTGKKCKNSLYSADKPTDKFPQFTLSFVRQESWQLRKGSAVSTDEAEYEEELYVAGHMVIWSRGTKSQASCVYKAFTVDSPVQQVSVIWKN